MAEPAISSLLRQSPNMEKVKIFLIALLLCVCIGSQCQTVNDLRPTVTMKEYVDAQIAARKEVTEAQFQNVLDNVNKANSVMDKRLDGMNEFRQTLQDSNKTYITKSELFAWVISLLMTFFAYSNYKANQIKASNEGKAILSGDKVEVKK